MVRQKLFAWSCQTNGKRNADGPAPDGEEYFAMALFSPLKMGRWRWYILLQQRGTKYLKGVCTQG